MRAGRHLLGFLGKKNVTLLPKCYRKRPSLFLWMMRQEDVRSGIWQLLEEVSARERQIELGAWQYLSSCGSNFATVSSGFFSYNSTNFL